jgi:hypothetical protein
MIDYQYFMLLRDLEFQNEMQYDNYLIMSSLSIKSFFFFYFFQKSPFKMNKGVSEKKSFIAPVGWKRRKLHLVLESTKTKKQVIYTTCFLAPKIEKFRSWF